MPKIIFFNLLLLVKESKRIVCKSSPPISACERHYK